jgi:hypothetical protein
VVSSPDNSSLPPSPAEPIIQPPIQQHTHPSGIRLITPAQVQFPDIFKAREKKRVNALPILRCDDEDKLLINSTVAIATDFISILGGSDPPSFLLVKELLTEAHTVASSVFSIKAAQIWGGEFVIPPAALAADLKLFQQCAHNLTTLCNTRHNALRHNRLSIERIHQTFGRDGRLVPTLDNADFLRLSEFANHGVSVLQPVGFLPSSTLPPLRTKYLAVAPAVHKLLFKQHAAGTVLFLPLSEVLSIPGIHFSPQHWTEKKGKPEGRTLGDLSNLEHNMPLNGSTGPCKDNLQERIQQQWGAITHPTLGTLARMILSSAKQHGWDNIIIWKKDLNAAFNLLWYKADDVRLLGFPLADGNVVFHLGGMFGWIGMPHSFQVVTRCLNALCNHLITGDCTWYVDDNLGISPSVEICTNDMRIVDTAV